jgi:hypothetical protein
VLFHDVHADDGITGGRRVDRENLALEIAVIMDTGGDNQLLVDFLAAAEKNDEVVFLRVFSLTFGPGDDVVGIV